MLSNAQLPPCLARLDVHGSLKHLEAVYRRARARNQEAKRREPARRTHIETCRSKPILERTEPL